VSRILKGFDLEASVGGVVPDPLAGAGGGGGPGTAGPATAGPKAAGASASSSAGGGAGGVGPGGGGGSGGRQGKPLRYVALLSLEKSRNHIRGDHKFQEYTDMVQEMQRMTQRTLYDLLVAQCRKPGFTHLMDRARAIAYDEGTVLQFQPRLSTALVRTYHLKRKCRCSVCRSRHSSLMALPHHVPAGIFPRLRSE
jgi:hypothetical protein